MANQLYGLARQGFATGATNFNWTGSNFYCCLVNAQAGQYVPNFSTDQYVNTLASYILANSRTALSGLTNALGVCKASNVTLGSANITGYCGAIVVYYNSGSDSTSNLIAYIDTGIGLPASSLSSATVNITWDSAGIFTL